MKSRTELNLKASPSPNLKNQKLIWSNAGV